MNEKVKQYSGLKYATFIVREVLSSGNECYVAENPELPGCKSQGDTREEAVRNLQEARELVIEHLIEHNLPVPLPAYLKKRGVTPKPVIQTEYHTKVESDYSLPPPVELVLA